ncbi:3-oxo-tetronate kinase [Agromyces sp. NPDC058136]|uniref:3-oxo-tetronate kinase n=1 Tax=Agromyces sp. NPDC058136 TaxID=3346354 RepID=UPI0036DEA717
MIGVIADDVTGATDVAAALSRAGLRTLLSLTAEISETASTAPADAVVIGLKTRSMPVEEAVALSLDALASLQGLGADRFYVKYCSTFDSTPEGNIGPITEALAAELGAGVVVTTPAAPVHGRTVYRGRLFVGDDLLDETHMRDHPVTPMRDSSVARLLAPQVSGRVGVLPLETVRSGAASVRDRIAQARAAGEAHLVADAVGEEDLAVIAEAVEDDVLVGGSAGLIGALALRRPASLDALPHRTAGRTAILAGSCSRRTLEQIGRFREEGRPSFRLIAGPGETADDLADRAVAWWDEQPADASALIYSSSPADEREHRSPALGELYERAAGEIAVRLAERGIHRLLIAGGETSGEVIRALGTTTAVVGEEAAAGVPWIHDTERGLDLVLKSGNFGSPELFVDVVRDGAEAR